MKYYYILPDTANKDLLLIGGYNYIEGDYILLILQPYPKPVDFPIDLQSCKKVPYRTEEIVKDLSIVSVQPVKILQYKKSVLAEVLSLGRRGKELYSSIAIIGAVLFVSLIYKKGAEVFAVSFKAVQEELDKYLAKEIDPEKLLLLYLYSCSTAFSKSEANKLPPIYGEKYNYYIELTGETEPGYIPYTIYLLRSQLWSRTTQRRICLKDLLKPAYYLLPLLFSLYTSLEEDSASVQTTESSIL